jgi:hypothetical protein
MIDKNLLLKKIPEIEPVWQEMGCRIYQKVWPGSTKSERLWGSVNAINSVSKITDCSNYNILDIGCNCGTLSVVASEHFKNAFGTDKDAKSIEGAKETAKFFNKDNCFFRPHNVKGYIENGYFEKDNIEAIMAYQVLYLLSDKEVKYLLDRMDNVKVVIFGARPSKNRSKNKYGLWSVKTIVKHLVKPFFSKHKVLYKYKSRWPLVIGYKES